MATEKEVLDEQGFVTDRISTQVRGIALSMIAVSWLFLSGGDQQYFKQPLAGALWGCILLSILALLLDYGQYVAGYFSIKRTLKRGQVGNRGYVWEYEAPTYRLRNALFVFKQIVLLAAVVAFLAALLIDL